MKVFWENKSSRKGKLFLTIFFSVFLAVIMCMVEKAEIYGESMRPFLMDGDHVLIEKLSCMLGGPKRFDVVVFCYRYEENRYYTKRIIGLPGETVQIIDGEVYIDGEKLNEETARELILEPGRADVPIILKEDEYFVLGDNRNHSTDSRSSDIGNVKKEELIGRVFWRFPVRETASVSASLPEQEMP